MENIIDLTGRKIIVVGASSGIGRQTAKTLDSVGASVIPIARREDKLAELVNELGERSDKYYVSDVSELDTIETLIKKIIEDNGPIDGMVYAAGIGTSTALMQCKPEKVKQMFDVNYFGFVETVRQICRKGRFNPGMRIVGVSSTASLRGDKAKTIYSSSKAAMNSAVRCIAKEVAEKGICINAVAPAMTATEMYNHFIEKFGEDSASNEELLKRQYLGIARTEDIANAIAFLISPAARFITGITLPVDGGTTSS